MDYEGSIAAVPAYQGTFFGSGEVPMTLCSLCRKLNVPTFLKLCQHYDKSIHQPSYSALLTSALNGCEFCALVMETVRRSYSILYRCSIDQAHEALHARSKMERPECLVFGRN